jgi:hypothetical protein
VSFNQNAEPGTAPVGMQRTATGTMIFSILQSDDGGEEMGWGAQ